MSRERVYESLLTCDNLAPLQKFCEAEEGFLKVSVIVILMFGNSSVQYRKLWKHMTQELDFQRLFK
jgi:hypothetical protein